MAIAFFGDLWRQFLLPLLELVELQLDQLVTIQLVVQRGEELGADAVLSNLERGPHPLGLGFEVADLGIGERIHRITSSRHPGPPIEKDTSDLNASRESRALHILLDRSGALRWPLTSASRARRAAGPRER
jgi:hypothetical protein